MSPTCHASCIVSSEAQSSSLHGVANNIGATQAPVTGRGTQPVGRLIGIEPAAMDNMSAVDYPSHGLPHTTKPHCSAPLEGMLHAPMNPAYRQVACTASFAALSTAAAATAASCAHTLDRQRMASTASPQKPGPHMHGQPTKPALHLQRRGPRGSGRLPGWSSLFCLAVTLLLS